MMLTARFQPRLQSATCCRARTSGRSAVLRVVAFKNGDEEQEQKQQMSKTKVTFQLPLHVEWGQEVALVGGVDTLGAWDVEKSIPMAWNDGDMWTAEAELPTDTPIQYKYVIRAGEGEVKAVVQWQPCNNLEVAPTAEQPELTIRDAWEGEHEVLPGTLPLPAPPAPEPQPEEEAPAPTEAIAEPVPVAVEAQAEAPFVAEAAPVEVAPAAPITVQAPEAAKPESAAAAVAAASSPMRRRSTTTSRGANGSKTNGANSRTKVVAAAAAEDGAPTVRYGSLSTNELKEVCKARGLPVKGQRKDLLARLQQLLQNGNKA